MARRPKRRGLNPKLDFQANVVIQNSSVCGLGAFTCQAIKRGTPVAFYLGQLVNATIRAQPWYTGLYTFFSSTCNRGYTADDPTGTLEFEHEGCKRLLTGMDLAASNNLNIDDFDVRLGQWHGLRSNWTRFVNHASGAFANLSVCTDRTRFGRAFTFYASCDIPQGSELFVSYGRSYFGRPGFPDSVIQPQAQRGAQRSSYQEIEHEGKYFIVDSSLAGTKK